MIITADCDLAQQKTGPTLTYLPILNHSTFLSAVWLREEIERLDKQALEVIDSRLSKFDANLKARHLDRWGNDGGEDGIKARLTEQLKGTLKDTFDADAAKLVEYWKARESLHQYSSASGQPLAASIKFMADCRELLNPNLRKRQGTNTAADLVESALLSIQERSDTWLIKELIGLDPDMHHGVQYGYVVPLRTISTIPVEYAVTERSAWYGDASRYLRICRLRGIYKSDLLQRFANLFVRVGVEDHRADEHRRLFKRFAGSIFPQEVSQCAPL